MRLITVATALLPMTALLALGHPALAQDAFYTTGTYTIDATHSVVGSAYAGLDSSFSSTNSMGNPYNPTVNLVGGGSIGVALFAYNSSQVSVSGGSIGRGLYATGSSLVNVSGGSIGGVLEASDSGRVNISGGSISGYLQAANSSLVNFSGGSIGGVLEANGSSQLNVSGGSIGSFLYAFSSSQVSVSGGSFGASSGVNIFDGTSGSFTLIGTGLQALNARPDLNFGGTDYDLLGTLLGGTNLRGYVLNVAAGSAFTLQNQAPSAAVPEPGTLALAGMGLLPLAGVLARRRKAKQ